MLWLEGRYALEISAAIKCLHLGGDTIYQFNVMNIKRMVLYCTAVHNV